MGSSVIFADDSIQLFDDSVQLSNNPCLSVESLAGGWDFVGIDIYLFLVQSSRVELSKVEDLNKRIREYGNSTIGLVKFLNRMAGCEDDGSGCDNPKIATLSADIYNRCVSFVTNIKDKSYRSSVIDAIVISGLIHKAADECFEDFSLKNEL